MSARVLVLAAGMALASVGLLAATVKDQDMLTQTFTRVLLAQSGDAAEYDLNRRFTEGLGRNIPALLLTLGVGSMASAAGVGGGAFFVPLFNVLLEFTLKGATALSQATITGGAIAAVGLSLHKRHPVDPSKPLIDYTMSLMLLPVLLLGVSVGVLANAIFPTWLITLQLTLLLLYLTYLTSRKAVSLHHAEQRAAARQREAELPASRQLLKCQDEEAGTCTPRHDLKTSAATDHAELPTPPTKPQASRMSAYTPGTDALKSSDALSAPRNEIVSRRGSEPLALSDENSWEFYQGDDDTDSALASASGDQHSKDIPSDNALGGEGSRHSKDSRSGQVEGSSSCEEGLDVLGGSERRPQRGNQEGGNLAGNWTRRNGVESGCSLTLDGVDCGDHDNDHVEEQEQASSRPRTPWVQISEMLALWVVFLALQLLKSHWPRCSLAYILIYCFQGVFCLACSFVFLWQAHTVQQRERAQQVNQPILENIYSTTAWTLPRLVRASVVTLVGGVVAGLLGIGGGMIIGPLLLQLGVHPLISSATSSLMVLFSSSSAMLSFAFDGTLNVQFALIFGLGCLGASLVGVLCISQLVRWSGKASIVVMLLASIIGAGAILTAVFGGRTAITDLSTGQDVGFGQFCQSS